MIVLSPYLSEALRNKTSFVSPIMFDVIDPSVRDDVPTLGTRNAPTARSLARGTAVELLDRSRVDGLWWERVGEPRALEALRSAGRVPRSGGFVPRGEDEGGTGWVRREAM